MQNPSRPVTSSQRFVHPGLVRQVLRQRASGWRKPAQSVDAPALERLDAALAVHRGALVLDSFCGTGHSSAALARSYPQALVIGVDKSAHRLKRGPEQSGELPANCLLLQAHCEAIWRHLAQGGRKLTAHYLLYPNPWPKAAQLSRRVHGHPAFGQMLALGGIIELRSNWQVYVEEFGVALHLHGVAARIAVLKGEQPVSTHFERKYRNSGHCLWQLRANLASTSQYTDGSGSPNRS